MYLTFKMLSITFFIIYGLHVIVVVSTTGEKQSSGVESSAVQSSEAQSLEDSTIPSPKTPDPADSIFSKSTILHDVQMSNAFGLHENFVKLQLINPKGDTLTEYDKIKNKVEPGATIDGKVLRNFVRKNFKPDEPKKSEKFKDTLNFEKISSIIDDEKYIEFHNKINQIWPQVAKQTDVDVANNPEQHSLLDVPECYIQEGDSNGMPTYWQNYLIVRGTLANSMRAIPTGIMRNIAYLIHKHGMALYSNKTYLSTRTQLPLLALMVEDYLAAAEEQDIRFLKEMLPAVVKEFHWWYKTRSLKHKINGKEYLMFRYIQSVDADRPRAEHYKHDYNLGSPLTIEDRKILFANLYSLDESGFENTTRFRRPTSDGKGSKLDIINIVPVELMSVLHRCASILSGWYLSLIKTATTLEKVEYQTEYNWYKKREQEILETITEVMYNDEIGVWFDYHIEDREQIQVYYATNLLPLVTFSYDIDRSAPIGDKIVEYLISEKIISDKRTLEPRHYMIPTSTKINGGRADYPSASLLLNLLVIEGLAFLDNVDTRVVARKLASLLVKTVYKGFIDHNMVLENYEATEELDRIETPSEPQLSPAAVGVVNLLLKSGSENPEDKFKSTDYDDFKPRIPLYAVEDEESKKPLESPETTGRDESSNKAEDEVNRERPIDETTGIEMDESPIDAEENVKQKILIESPARTETGEPSIPTEGVKRKRPLEATAGTEMGEHSSDEKDEPSKRSRAEAQPDKKSPPGT